MLGSAIEEFLTFKRGSEGGEASSAAASSAAIKGVVAATSPGKAARTAGGKVAHWFTGGNKEDQQNDSCEASLCSSLKDLFVK